MVCAIPQRDIPLVVFQLSGRILPEALSPIQLWGFWYQIASTHSLGRKSNVCIA